MCTFRLLQLVLALIHPSTDGAGERERGRGRPRPARKLFEPDMTSRRAMILPVLERIKSIALIRNIFNTPRAGPSQDGTSLQRKAEVLFPSLYRGGIGASGLDPHGECRAPVNTYDGSK